jgi:hypothetical protein
MYVLATNGRSYRLQVDFTNYDDKSMYAEYFCFYIGPDSDNYTMHVSGYSGTAAAGKYINCHSIYLHKYISSDTSHVQALHNW